MKKIVVLMISVLMVIALVGCRESEKVSYNISKEADYFNVIRRVAVINTIDGTPLFECIGRISVDTDTENKLVILVEVGENKYKKHIIGLNTATTMYVLEDIKGADVGKYTYELNYNPNHFKVFSLKNIE